MPKLMRCDLCERRGGLCDYHQGKEDGYAEGQDDCLARIVAWLRAPGAGAVALALAEQIEKGAK